MQGAKFNAAQESVRCFARTLDSVLASPTEDGNPAMIAAISAQCQDRAAGVPSHAVERT